MHLHRGHLSLLHTLWRSKSWAKPGAELAIVKWCETLGEYLSIVASPEMKIMRSILHQLGGCVGLWMCGEFGVAGKEHAELQGILWKENRESSWVSHYCRGLRKCLSRSLFVCDTLLFTRQFTLDQPDQVNFSKFHFTECRFDVVLSMRSSRVSCGGKT
jgi:hypothetical protein